MSLVDVPTGPILAPWPTREIVDPAEIQRAVEDLAAWGFPRAIEPYEAEFGSWFRMGRGLIFWIEPPIEQAPGAAIIHLAVAPRYRSCWPVRRWDMAAQIIAELMGATHLLAQIDSGRVRDYALRLGWQADGPRLFRTLGGMSRGERRADLHEGCVEGR